MFENPDLIKRMALENAKKLSAKDQTILAERYLFGKGVEKDLNMAFQIYQMAADKNNTAKFNLARMYLKGDGTAKDINKAVKLLEELMKSNDNDAINKLAALYYAGDGVKQDKQLALKLYKQTANKGSLEGMYYASYILHHDEDIPHDYNLAMKYYQNMAKKDMATAFCSIGYMHEYGQGVEIDNQKAIEYYKKAAEKNDYVAKYNLGCSYFDGRIVEQDYQKAYNYLVESVDAGYSRAKYSLAYMYYTGRGVEPDLEKAKELFLEAANEKECQSLYMLGYMHNVGHGFEQDYVKALNYYMQAAENGSSEAYADIGVMYTQGRGVEVDYNKAKEYFEIGISKGDNMSKCNLAAAYINGTGVDIDMDKAIDILASVDNDFINKYYFLGVVKKDCIKVEDKTKEKIEESIAEFNEYLKLVPKADDTRYLPVVYFKLSEAYLELYYYDQANEKDRTKQHFENVNENREKAKEYLNLATTNKDSIQKDLLETFENDLRIVEDLLNDECVDLSSYTYETFKEQFFGKYDNLFLFTNKKEYELFDEGIKYYFNKREKEEESNKKINIANKDFENRKSLIRKKLEQMGVENIDEKLEELRQAKIKETKNNLDLDFSTVVVNTDKYLEEILHFIFVDCKYNHTKDLYKNAIATNIQEIKNLLTNCSENTLKELNLILNGIDKSVNLKPEILAKKLEIFAGKFNKNWNWKSIEDDKILNLATYFREEKENLNQEEKTIIEKMIENHEARVEYANMEKPERFELGKLFYMAFGESQSAGSIGQKSVDPAFVEFVMSANENLNTNQASLKLRELLIKVEMFRVIVRNVASHKSTLNQAAVEQGLNISLIQENSIFKLLDEMFGNFLNEKYVEQVVSGIQI